MTFTNGLRLTVDLTWGMISGVPAVFQRMEKRMGSYFSRRYSISEAGTPTNMARQGESAVTRSFTPRATSPRFCYKINIFRALTRNKIQVTTSFNNRNKIFYYTLFLELNVDFTYIFVSLSNHKRICVKTLKKASSNN